MNADVQRSHQILRQTGLGIFKRILPVEKIEGIVRERYPEYRERALSVPALLALLVYGHFEKGIGSVQELLTRAWSRLRGEYGIQTQTPVSKQAFSQRLKELPWKIFQAIFVSLYQDYQIKAGAGAQTLLKGQYVVQVMDGSLLDVAARLIRVFKGVPGRGGAKGKKAQAKMHTLLNVALGVPQFIVIGSGVSSEIKKARRMLARALQKAKSILVWTWGTGRSISLSRSSSGGPILCRG